MRRPRCSDCLNRAHAVAHEGIVAVIDTDTIPTSRIDWLGAARITRTTYRRVDYFDDIADPEDWSLLLAAEQVTGGRFEEGTGELRPIPAARRVTGPRAGHLMNPFFNMSPDRGSRFSDGKFGILYAGRTSDVALLETMYHHGRFMAATEQVPGWTSHFLEIALNIDASLHDLRGLGQRASPFLDAEDYTAGQALGRELHASGSDGIAYPSVRHVGGECAALFYPDLASNVREKRYLDYHWNGSRVDLYRDLDRGDVYRC